MSKDIKDHSRLQESLKELTDLIDGNDNGFVFHTRKVPTPPEYSAKEIKRIRQEIPATQKVFAQIVSASPRTVEAWEAGRTRPTGPARRLIQIIEQNPKDALKFV